MKKTILMATAMMIFAQGAQASCGLGQPGSCRGTTMTMTITPLLLSNLTYQKLGLENDIIQIQDDAVVALETGAVSSELKSVVDKIRAEYSEETANASDLEVVEMVFGDI